MSGWSWQESPADVAIRHLLVLMDAGASVHYHGLEVLRLDAVRWCIAEALPTALTETVRALAAHRQSDPLAGLHDAVEVLIDRGVVPVPVVRDAYPTATVRGRAQ